MGWFKENIFGLFGNYYKLLDSYKESDPELTNKGLLERYNEIIGEDIDEDIALQLETMLQNLHSPELCQTRYFDIIDESLGKELFINNLEITRRNLLKHIIKFYQIRGSEDGYALLFQMLGFTSTSFTFFNLAGLDQGLFDDVDGTLDSSGTCCTYYDIYLTGTVPVTLGLKTAILSIIKFNEPINAKFRDVYIDGVPINFEEATFICLGYLVTSPEIGQDVVVSIGIKNTSAFDGYCDIEFDYDEYLYNGGTPLDSDIIYQTEEGFYEHYNLKLYDMITLIPSSDNYVVLGAAVDNPTMLINYGVYDTGKVKQSGIMTILSDAIKVEIGQDDTAFDSDEFYATTDVEFIVDITAGGDIRLNIKTGAVSNLTFNYRFI